MRRKSQVGVCLRNAKCSKAHRERVNLLELQGEYTKRRNRITRGSPCKGCGCSTRNKTGYCRRTAACGAPPVRGFTKICILCGRAMRPYSKYNYCRATLECSLGQRRAVTAADPGRIQRNRERSAKRQRVCRSTPSGREAARQSSVEWRAKHRDRLNQQIKARRRNDPAFAARRRGTELRCEFKRALRVAHRKPRRLGRYCFCGVCGCPLGWRTPCRIGESGIFCGEHAAVRAHARRAARDGTPCTNCGKPTISKIGICTRATCRKMQMDANRYGFVVEIPRSPCEWCGRPTSAKHGVCQRKGACRNENRRRSQKALKLKRSEPHAKRKAI